MASYTKISLLEKYGLQIDQLDYKFIGALKDVKTMERILIVLRSGQEGIYPDLIKFCENRLQELAPKSRLLHPARKVKKFNELSQDERRDIENQLESWWNNAEEEEKIKESSLHINKDIPPIRGNSIKIETSKKKANTTPCGKVDKKRSTLRSYSEWEKFDVDEELKKLDESENNDCPKPLSDDKKKLHNDSELQPLVCISDLSEKERQYVADREKNKGNEAFKAHDYGEAVFYYTRSLSAYKSVVALNNRAQAHIELNNYLAAIQDCNKVLLMDPNNLKALYRRGLALKRNEMYDLAELDFRTLLELDAENKPAKEQLKEIKKMRLTNPENKKVVIEEIKSDEIETPEIEMKQREKTVKGTRMKIEEVSTTENTEKLTNLNYNSSDEDENIAHLPIKVKQMLQVNKTSKKQKGQTSKFIDENAIEKTSIRETNRNVQKLKIIEECEQVKVNKNASNKNSKFEGKVVRIDIEDSISNKENPKQYNKCSPKSKQLNCINSVNKKVVLETTEKNAIIVEDEKALKTSKENMPNEDNSTNPTKHLTKTETSNTDFNYNNIIINNDQNKNEKNEIDIISKEDNTRKSNEQIMNTNGDMIANGNENGKQHSDSTKVKNILEDPVSNQNMLREVNECEMNNKEFTAMNFNDETINDNKLCKLECLTESFNEPYENKTGKYCNVNLSECNVFNPEDTANYKEGNAKIFEKGLSSKSVEYLNELVVTTQSKEEINVNKTDYLVANNWQENKNISIFNSTEKEECNGSIFDAGQEIPSSKNKKNDVSDSAINNTKTVNGIQTHKKVQKMYFDEETEDEIDEDTPDYGVNTFTVQDTFNNKTLNEIMDNNAEPQVLLHENIGRTENYKINDLDSFKALEEEMKNKECTYNNTEKDHDSETGKTHTKIDYVESEDEFIDVENDYPLKEISIQKSKEQTQQCEMNLTNSRYKNIKEDTKFVEHPQSSFNSSKRFEERREDNDCCSNYTRGENVDHNENETLNEKDTEVFIKESKPLKSVVIENDVQYEKVSPYEFLCTWCLNDDKDVKAGALNLLKMKPEELPQIISNKLEASMLAGILKAISAVCKMGKYAEGENYLYYLTRVPRINIAAMFLTAEEIKSIHDLFSELEYEHGLHMKYVNMILQS